MEIHLALITLEIIAIFLGIAQIFIPVLSIIRMFKSNDSSRVLYTFFLVSIFLSYFAFINGLLIASLPIICLNILSFFINFTYLVCYIVCSQNDKQAKAINLVFLLTGISISIGGSYLIISLTPFAYGITVSIVNCVLFFTPFQNVPSIIKNNDYSYIQIEILIIMLCNALSSIANGIAKKYNFYYIIPNAIGCFIMMSLIVLWSFYYIKKETKNNIPTYSHNINKHADEETNILLDSSKSSYLTFEDSDD